MPWLALPFADHTEKKFTTLQTDAVGLIQEYGIWAYPFTKEQLDELEAEEKARQEAQTLESLLVSDESNFVLKHEGAGELLRSAYYLQCSYAMIH